VTPANPSTTRERLRTDFRFAVVSLFSVVAIAGVLPFSIYRFASGNSIAGAVDLGIVLSILGGAVHAWRGGDVARVGLLIVIACTGGCVTIGALTGLPGLLWTYPVLLANYLLVSPGRALVVSILAVGLSVLLDRGLHAGMLMTTYATTASVVSAFSYIFAHRTERQRARLQALATRDPLTGAYNRRAMDHELALAVEAHRRHGAPFALVLLDLDEFKRINDAHGHEAGDAVLVELTRLLQRHFRKLDRIYRLGGEEFVVLLSGAETRSLAAVCESLRARIERDLRHGDAAITVSAGVAALGKDETPTQWLARADAALYRAKGAGRNRVEVDVSGIEAESTGRRHAVRGP
jgi:diguanylate cyclase (GGDEF)-like protein